MTTLVRLTVVAPRRRIDLAVPEPVPIAELLPEVLRHAGEPGESGWLLRRADGTPLDDALPLGPQRVDDGTVLHLVRAEVQWPEPEYDDLVGPVADGVGRTGRTWGPKHSRWAGLAAASLAVVLGLVVILRTASPWYDSAALAAGLLVAGTVLARAVGDAGAGAVLAGLSLPAAFVTGLALGQPGVAAGRVLGGCSMLVVATVLGALGTVDRPAVFAASGTMALGGGAAAATIAAGLGDLDRAGAVLATGFLLFSPLTGPLSARLARVPMPVLPRTAADLVRLEPQPPRSVVYAAVLRADGLLTGVIAGGSALSIGAVLVLAGDLGPARLALLALLSIGFGLRARLYPAVRHRLPLLLVAAAGAGGLIVAGPLPAVPVLTGCIAVSTVAGLVSSRRAPGAYLSRYAELAELAVVLACTPVLVVVLGLLPAARGLGS